MKVSHIQETPSILELIDEVAGFFAFDQNGDKFWTFGVSTPTGKSFTPENAPSSLPKSLAKDRFKSL